MNLKIEPTWVCSICGCAIKLTDSMHTIAFRKNNLPQYVCGNENCLRQARRKE